MKVKVELVVIIETTIQDGVAAGGIDAGIVDALDLQYEVKDFYKVHIEDDPYVPEEDWSSQMSKVCGEDNKDKNNHVKQSMESQQQ
ncbi:Hypothetical predicted protein [Octopus vulgaris]|uniref:Uncharacterized protein n=1 Tax=Octopus vulgaris TaxID=6645 RepID=A0AA36FBW2_OCTVU|nr:Hypothetical predicted protein [Octopus vulgaris]